MLPRKNRVSRKEFPTYPTRGIRASSPFFTVVLYPQERSVSVSVVVSKKTAKTAVLRNKLRRRLYAAIEPSLKTFIRGVIIVFYPNVKAETAPLDTLRSEITEILKKQNLIPKDSGL